jgi:hypothetical protein
MAVFILPNAQHGSRDDRNGFFPQRDDIIHISGLIEFMPEYRDSWSSCRNMMVLNR